MSAVKEINVVYVVSEVGFEYNDEILFRPDCGVGTPIKAYQSLETAMREMYNKTIKELGSINQYGYEPNEVVDCYALFSLLSDMDVLNTAPISNLNLKSADDVEKMDMEHLEIIMEVIVPKLSDDDKARLVDALQISFYEITTLEITG